MLSILEPIEYFNSHIVDKRKDKIPQGEKIDNKDKVLYEIHEFNELPLNERAMLCLKDNRWRKH